MLTKEDVLKIAKLSKLEFQEDEIEKFQTDLNKILEHMEILNNVDTTGVEPLFNVLDLKDRLRKDEVQSVDIKKELLKNAPNKDDDFIIVPKIVGGGNTDN
ncbi:Asp-tRNA(Asn)/Glu-tRNA(Gln) amidotransferase subunit GatC [Pseudoleptotrichia goodfellowii]|jgi:aspartyl/glutamyl-tRNA(asn/gln) amidotransferase, C subunit|uniref:Aspartyl/glutamyl-tRNA(Asn/Gln) amidotransferase subunit C n=2 Tax=Pseudoleptotrichia goodfellowii TaxID=157692 RepID=D0GMK7_9FUSO|nr:Asp-tRNA(Asn)/Glu-tRNA(Gln) amidotransferase subunit GatC [Pseudoleptotrichia goodfellowii]EEY34673.1 aspartyl/glutamyl-tRNA(Asn/Gln) amidotransferase, C subunit [Pseudoleptotrichia goodfellowii F0264]BBM35278.1 glutamyl-tRNA(Gln) amidotransferase subunit C [Pseudoleptotrichia goodfellowii]